MTLSVEGNYSLNNNVQNGFKSPPVTLNMTDSGRYTLHSSPL